MARYFRRLASFSRLIMFDRRGSGMSDPLPRAPTLEEQMDDVVAVMDAAGSERAAVFALLEGGRDGGAVRGHTSRADDGARALRGPAADVVGARLRLGDARRGARGVPAATEASTSWGDGSRILALSPSSADNLRLRNWYGRARAAGGEPRDGGEADADERAGRRSGRAAARSRCRRWCSTAAGDQMIDIRHSRYLAEHIPGARLVELPGDEAISFGPEARDELDEIEEFLTGARPGPALRTDPRHGDVLGHRRLDDARGRARRPALARSAAVDRDLGRARADALPRPGGEDDGRRLPGHVRRSRPGDQVRDLDPRLGALAVRARGSQRAAHRERSR